MKKTKFLIGACLAFVLAGCSDDDVVKTEVTLPVSGDEVMFGASSGKLNVPQSRTIYGEPDDYEDYSELTINWQVGQDQVRVYSPQASIECLSADYTVREQTTEGSYYLEKNGEIGVRWGDTNTFHEFYAFYPLNVDDNTGGTIPISGLKNSTVVSANIPVAQDRGNIQERVKGGTTWKIVAPNMTYCMMVGRGSWASGADRNVPLTFTPIVLVLDVVINAGDTNYKIAGVQVRSKNQPIVGSFNYDVADGSFTYTSPSGDNNNQAWVDCSDENGDPLTLEPNQKLNVKFFLLPQTIQASELTVSVLLENGQTLSQALIPNGSATEDKNLINGQIIKVRTPKINPAEESTWMSMIDNDVLFASQLSLPGSKHSYTYQLKDDELRSYDANSGIMRTFQTKTIDEQFDAGIRAFDVKLAGRNANIYVGTQSTSMTIGDMLTSIKLKLNAAPTEFVIIGVNYVDDGMSEQEWLTAVCNAIDTWSDGNPRTDSSEDGSTLNNEDGDYFREVISTTTVGVMRHGIGIMIHYPEANPSFSSNNVNVIPSYSTSVQNTSLVQYDIQSQRGTGHVTIQDLQQMNDPELNRYPYYITEQYALGTATSMDLIQTKKNLISELFTLSRTNNAGQGDNRTNNLYVNDLGGFCVVNNNESTGFVTWDYYTYRDHVFGGFYWDEPVNPFDQQSGTVTNYTDLPTGYDYYNKHDDAPEATSGSWCRIDDENAQLGQGGNNALLAEQINGYAAELIYGVVNEGRTPLGVVYMNFAGEDAVTFNGRSYNVNGVRLPSLIMSNNFKFPLATSNSTSGN